MSSHTSTKTHFGMDDRGLGGTHMIQQQFLTMHRKVRDAQKQVDNNPPTTSMFRRPYFSQFGEFWERIKPPQIQTNAKVDSSAPKSYKLIANLYINKKKKVGSEGKRKSASASPRKKVFETTSPEIESKRLIDVPNCNSLDEYADFCQVRRQAISEEMQRLKKLRFLKSQHAELEAAATDDVSGAAKAALMFIDNPTHQNSSQSGVVGSVQLRSPQNDEENLDLTAVSQSDSGTVPSPPPRTRPGGNKHDMFSPTVATPRRMEAVSQLTPNKMNSDVPVPHPPSQSAGGLHHKPTPPPAAGRSAQQNYHLHTPAPGQVSRFEDDEDQWDDHQ